MTDLTRRLAAEALGSAVLVTTVVGSGIMAASLTSDGAIALLCNTLPTAAILVVLVDVLSPISGAHLNPAVSLVRALRGEIAAVDAVFYAMAQIGGAISGTFLAHLMFAVPVIEVSAHLRAGWGQWLSEGVATFGLVVVILGSQRSRSNAVAMRVGLYIAAAYWFTASTSFANPAVAIARAFSDTFTGIRPENVPGFIVAELTGALTALASMTWLLRRSART